MPNEVVDAAPRTVPECSFGLLVSRVTPTHLNFYEATFLPAPRDRIGLGVELSTSVAIDEYFSYSRRRSESSRSGRPDGVPVRLKLIGHAGEGLDLRVPDVVRPVDLSALLYQRPRHVDAAVARRVRGGVGLALADLRDDGLHRVVLCGQGRSPVRNLVLQRLPGRCDAVDATRDRRRGRESASLRRSRPLRSTSMK